MSQIVVFGAGAHTLYVTVARPRRPRVGEARHLPAPSSPGTRRRRLRERRPAGNLSLVETLNVPGCPGWPVLVSFTASITGLLVVPVQFVHVGSPPPVTVAVFTVGFAAFAATATGTVITTGPWCNKGQSNSPPDSSHHRPDSQRASRPSP